MSLRGTQHPPACSTLFLSVCESINNLWPCVPQRPVWGDVCRAAGQSWGSPAQRHGTNQWVHLTLIAAGLSPPACARSCRQGSDVSCALAETGLPFRHWQHTCPLIILCFLSISVCSLLTIRAVTWQIIDWQYIWVHQSCRVKCCWAFSFGEKSLWMWFFFKHTCGLSLTFHYQQLDEAVIL